MSNSAHGPARLSTYITVHENHMQMVRGGGVIHHDTLKFKALPSTITLTGEIACLGNIIVQVNKMLVIVEPAEDPEVQTITYAYNAWVRNHKTFLRYDNSHPHKGHADRHHKHILDWRTGRGRVEWVGVAAWPTLTDVLHEVESWYWANREDLPDRDKVAQLGLWGPSQTDGESED